MYNIAVMGDRDSVYGFAALGLDTYYITEDSDLRREFKKLAGGSYAIIYITEAAASMLREEIEALEEKTLPAVILIPGISGNTGEGIKNVKHSVERAVGSDIIFND